jgi:hypothetical protein
MQKDITLYRCDYLEDISILTVVDCHIPVVSSRLKHSRTVGCNIPVAYWDILQLENIAVELDAVEPSKQKCKPSKLRTTSTQQPTLVSGRSNRGPEDRSCASPETNHFQRSTGRTGVHWTGLTEQVVYLLA